MTEQEFIAETKHVKGSRKHTYINSYGVRDYYFYYHREHKKLTEPQFSAALHMVLIKLRELLLESKDVILPHGMGKIAIDKQPRRVVLVNDKIITNLTINWNETLKLWYSDKKSRDNKKLVRNYVDYTFKIRHFNSNKSFKNRVFFKFRPNRCFKLALKDAIINNSFDSFLYGREKYRN